MRRPWVMHEHVSNNRSYKQFKGFKKALFTFFDSTIPNIVDLLVDRITDNFHIRSLAKWSERGICKTIHPCLDADHSNIFVNREPYALVGYIRLRSEWSGPSTQQPCRILYCLLIDFLHRHILTFRRCFVFRKIYSYFACYPSLFWKTRSAAISNRSSRIMMARLIDLETRCWKFCNP